ncbi:MAG: recombinase family protein [Clostridia bacterium]|nr:recombinase family protein [Clostridia bacterium]
MVGSEIYKVGIYLRLSREDDKQGESGSISNQRDIIHKYIKDNNLIYIDEYVDDGVSGTTFERDGFNRMIDDIENKRINMVVTKDLSRFGRNEGQQLRYIDYFFEKGIRYVSLLDNVDTSDEYNTSNEMMPLQFFFNEKHVRDTSKKMKASVYNKRINGNFLGSSAPYGYNKDPDNKYRLVIDEEAAIIVRRIFNMFVSGIGICEICRILTDEKIPIPSEYKKLNRGLKSTAYGVWTTRTVSDMLRLPTYAGDLTQGRLKKPSYKSKRIIRPNPKDWIVCKDKCPAIIDRETFELAQAIYERNKNQGKNTQDILLKGFVYCKECGHTIGFRLQTANTKKNGEVTRCYGNCNYWGKHKRLNVCTPHNIKYYELEELVLSEIKKMCKRYLKTDSLKEVLKNNDKTIKMQRDLDVELSRLKAEVSSSTQKIDALYNDKLEGIIDTDMYKRIYNQITEGTIIKQNEIKEIEKKIYNIKNKIIDKDNKYDDVIKEYLSMKRPSIQLLSSIIDKIVIDEEKNIDIYYKFKPMI